MSSLMRLTRVRRLLSRACRIGMLALVCAAQLAHSAKPYKYFAIGDTTDVVQPRPAYPSLVLMGGGPDVDDAFKWMIQKGGNGNFVVIRASGTDAYNPYVFSMGGVRSVETIVVPSREAANDPFVLQRIRGAEELFIAGGDHRGLAPGQCISCRRSACRRCARRKRRSLTATSPSSGCRAQEGSI